MQIYTSIQSYISTFLYLGIGLAYMKNSNYSGMHISVLGYTVGYIIYLNVARCSDAGTGGLYIYNGVGAPDAALEDTYIYTSMQSYISTFLYLGFGLACMRSPLLTASYREKRTR